VRLPTGVHCCDTITKASQGVEVNPSMIPGPRILNSRLPAGRTRDKQSSSPWTARESCPAADGHRISSPQRSRRDQDLESWASCVSSSVLSAPRSGRQTFDTAECRLALRAPDSGCRISYSSHSWPEGRIGRALAATSSVRRVLILPARAAARSGRGRAPRRGWSPGVTGRAA